MFPLSKQYFNCNAGPDTVNESNTWKDGCLNSTQLYMQKHAAIMGGAGIAVACLMVNGICSFIVYWDTLSSILSGVETWDIVTGFERETAL